MHGEDKNFVNRVKEFRITSCLAAREEMLTQGFTNWSKRDFNAFIRVRESICEYYFTMFSVPLLRNVMTVSHLHKTFLGKREIWTRRFESYFSGS